MGCFYSKEDEQYKVDLQTAKLLSLSGDEDRQARQEIEGKKAEIGLSEKKQKKEEIRLEKPKDRGKRKQEEADDQEDKQLVKTNDEKQKMYPKDDVKEAVNPPPTPPASIYDRGKSVIEGGNSVNPQALCCQICQEPFAMNEIAKKGKYHRICFKELLNSICYVCKIKITEKGRKYKEHHFWKGKYCPDHENDGTSKCCSCERLEPQGESTYVMLDDFRWLCLECMESSVMDSIESLPLHMDIRGFLESKELIIEKQFPVLMVDKQGLNSAEKEEKIDYHHAVITRGLCLSEVQTVPSIITRPTGRGPRNRLTGMITEKQEVSGCEVTGILIIYGLPRLLTGYILAHEMMHAWLRLNGYKDLKLELEEGLCQVLALMWLESHTFSFAEAHAAASSSSSRAPLAATTSKKGDAWSDYEKRLQEFCIYQIKEDESPVYGQGFKKVYKMMDSNNYSVKETLKEIVSASKAISKS